MRDYLEKMLFGLTALDPATFIAVSLMFAVTSTLSPHSFLLGAPGVDHVAHAVPFDVPGLDLLVLWGEERAPSAP
jgi:hypothetical protein